MSAASASVRDRTKAAWAALTDPSQQLEGAERRSAQLEALQQVSQDLAALQDLDTLLRQIVVQAMQLLGGEAGGIFLYRPELDLLEWAVDIGDNPATVGMTKKRGEGLSGKVWESGQPMIVDKDSSWEDRTHQWPDKPAAVIGVPIQWGDEFLGVLNIRASNHRGPFAPDEGALLTQFATQAAVAIRNTRLYEQAQAEIGERRKAEARYRSLFDNVPIAIYRTTPDGRILDANPGMMQMMRYPDRETLLALNVIDLYIDPAHRSRWQEMIEQEEVAQRELQLRCYDGAVIWVQDYSRVIRDAEGKVMFYEGSMENITERKRAQEAEREQKRLAETLRDVTLTLTSQTDPSSVLAEIVRQARRLVPYSAANIALLEDNQLRIAHLDGYPESVGKTLTTPPRPVDALPLDKNAIESCKPVAIPDTEKSSDWQDLGHTRWRSYLSVPIILRERVVGLLRLNGDRPNQFSQKDAERLEPLANAAAIAFENARLFEETRRQTAELEAVRQVALNITSQLDLRELLQGLADSVVKMLGAYSGAVYLYRPDRDVLEWIIRIGPGSAPIGLEIRKGEGVAGTVWQEGKPVILDEYAALDKPLQALEKLVIGSVVGVPIQSGDRFLGVLAATNLPDSATPFTEQSSRLLTLFADQAAVAIKNAQLFEQAQEEISERKRAEQERELLLTQIQEQASQMQQIIDTVPEAVLLLGDAGQVLLTNPRGNRTLATLANATVGDELTHLGDRSLHELLTSPPSGLWHEVNAGHQVYEVIAQPLELGPRPAGWVLVIRNVTRERGVQQRQQQQERLAAVGQLAAGIAHDFNNIMSAIVLHAQISLLAPDVPLEVQDRLTAVAEQAKRAGALIQQILDFSRRSVLERQPLDLLPILKEEVQLLQRTLPENIDVGLLYEPGRYMINADLTRIQQVIMNLAVNARDAMPDGGELYLELGCIHVPDHKAAPLVEMEPGDWVRLKIADTGAGISDDVLPHIYEPFFTTKSPDRGSGLGLAQVYGIVKQHKGHIVAESEIGEGTAFTLYLPVLTRPEKRSHPELAPSLPHGQGETILVVEDNAGAREAMVSGLKLLNYRVLEAENGLEAFDIHLQRQQEIALVLTDLVMPEMGGKQLLHALRQRDPAVKVMIMTGHPMNDEGVSPKTTGAVGWLQKPVSLIQLAEAMAEALRES